MSSFSYVVGLHLLCSDATVADATPGELVAAPWCGDSSDRSLCLRVLPYQLWSMYALHHSSARSSGIHRAHIRPAVREYIEHRDATLLVTLPRRSFACAYAYTTISLLHPL